MRKEGIDLKGAHGNVISWILLNSQQGNLIQ